MICSNSLFRAPKSSSDEQPSTTNTNAGPTPTPTLTPLHSDPSPGPEYAEMLENELLFDLNPIGPLAVLPKPESKPKPELCAGLR